MYTLYSSTVLTHSGLSSAETSLHSMGIMSSKTDPSVGERSTERLRITSDSALDASTPNITDVIPLEVLRDLFSEFLGPGHYRYVAGTCRLFRNAYESAMPGKEKRNTTLQSASASVACAELCLREADNDVNCKHYIATTAAQRGQVDVIDWLYNHGYEVGSCLFVQAGACGQLEVFQWANAKSLKWNYMVVANRASETGNAKVLIWMRDHGAACETFEGCFALAARHGHVTVLEGLARHGIPVTDIRTCWYNATASGHVKALDWLLENVLRLHSEEMGVLAISGFITTRLYSEVMGGDGQNRLRSALQRQNIRWSSKFCACAAYHGHLDTLKWLRRNKCPWDGNVMHWAEVQHHSDVLEWARNNGCPTEAALLYTRQSFGNRY
jgi:hypothetical protein